VIGAIPLRVIDGVSLLLMGGVYAVAPPHPVLDPIASVVTYLVYALTIWEIVILVLCMAEVHRFGITRAVLAVLLGVLIPLAAIGIPVLDFTLLGLR
jgi:hypothetical protein